MRALLAIAFLCIASTADAESLFLRGAGTRTCADFARNYAQNATFFETAYFAWAQGYMSAQNLMFNEMGSHKYKDLGGDDANQQLFIRNYCDKHPLALYKEAVDALFITLPMLDISKGQ